MNKQELRTEIRNRKRQFTQAQLGELSLSIIMQLKKHPRLRKAQTILLYYSLPDEVNTHEWIDEIVAEGKKSPTTCSYRRRKHDFKRIYREKGS